MEALITTQLSAMQAAEKLRVWQGDNLFTSIKANDLVMAPIRDTEAMITEYLWFRVTSNINIKWITGVLLTTPEKTTIVRPGGHLTFRKSTVMDYIQAN